MRHLLLIVLLAGSISSISQNKEIEEIKMANNEYTAGHYEKAIELYNSVINSGYESPELYYNLANAYFKTDAIPESILYYEKALKLDPRNEDIKFNLKIANSRKIDKIEAVPELFYVGWWKSFKLLFSPNQWTYISIILFFLVFLFTAVFFISRNYKARKLSFWVALLAVILFTITLVISIQSHNEYMSDDYAILFDPTITVKSSPSESSVDLFVIHEGTKVKILDQIEGWYEIKIANGSEGWIPDSSLKKI